MYIHFRIQTVILYISTALYCVVFFIRGQANVYFTEFLDCYAVYSCFLQRMIVDIASCPSLVP